MHRYNMPGPVLWLLVVPGDNNKVETTSRNNDIHYHRYLHVCSVSFKIPDSPITTAITQSYLKNKEFVETTGEETGGKPTLWPMGTVTIQQIHRATLASVKGNVRGDLKALQANLLTAASQGHSAELLGWTSPLGTRLHYTF